MNIKLKNLKHHEQDKPYRQKLVVEWDRYGKEYPDDDILELRAKYLGMVSYCLKGCY